jgi:hypothetical protein
MNETKITRAYLETLSFQELSRLADDYGIDVPENLDRRFLISELLEISEEFENEDEEEMIISSDEEPVEIENNLPENYNETDISCVLRNPVWLFVFWNMNESDLVMLKKLGDYTLKLRVCFFEDSEQTVPTDAFEVQASTEKQEQYVLIPSGKKYLKVELVYVTAVQGKVLAFSPVVKIPQGSEMVYDSEIGFSENFSEIAKLSDIQDVLAEQYTNHRHSFSE